MRLLKNGQELKAKSLFEAAEQQENIKELFNKKSPGPGYKFKILIEINQLGFFY